jgi:hypothetical protein
MHLWRLVTTGLSCLAATMIVASGAVFGCAATGNASSCCCGHGAKSARLRTCCAGQEAETTPHSADPVRCGACCERDEAVGPFNISESRGSDGWQALLDGGLAAIVCPPTNVHTTLGQYLLGASPPGSAHAIAPSMNVLLCTFQE